MAAGDPVAAAADGGPRGEDGELIMFLEPDQLVADKTKPVPRAVLSTRASALLWALRVFVVAVSAMVIYTFVSHLA